MNINYVNVLTGTYNDFRFSNGNIYPVTAIPNGLAFFSVQNHGDRHGWWFNPMDPFIEGIRLTHQPSPWISDYGQLLLYPQSGKFRIKPEDRWTHLKDFKMTPTLMEGYLSHYQIKFKLTPSKSGALIHVDYQKEDEKRFNIYGFKDTHFEVVDDYTIRGYTTAVNHDVDHEIKEYFYLISDAPFITTVKDLAISLLVEQDQVTFRFATSFISYEQALINDKRELNQSFDATYNHAKQLWDERLNKISIKTTNKADLEMFYTALYRINLFPRAFHEFDENNEPHHFNPHRGKVFKGYYYVDNGFWDTFRTNYPFLSLVYPELYKEIILGYQNYFDENGWYPKWISPNEVSSMTGTLSEAVMSEAVIKGVFTNKEAKHVLNCLIENATKPSKDLRFGRKIPDLYEKLGYIPYNLYPYSTSETLDYSYGDYAISLVAKYVGDEENYNRFRKRSLQYKKLFDPKTGFLRSKDEHNQFRADFNPFDWGDDYIEGGAWQCAFSVFHDFKGLNELYQNKLSEKIDELFSLPPFYNVSFYGREIHEMSELASLDLGQCAISNQPSFHIPFIYAALGDIQKTHAVVKKMTKLFTPTIKGYPGDEDNGSMSGLYLFSMMGFYPINPASGNYVISGPILDEVVIHLDKDLIIQKNQLDLATIKHEVSYFDLIKGGNLHDKV